jgi:hypothetical protein
VVQVILNIGLRSSPASTNPQATIPENCRAALEWVQARASTGTFRTGRDETDEDTLIFTGELVPAAKLGELAEVANQDCIAVWFLSKGTGSLVGPRTQPWEPFDVSKFLWTNTNDLVLH